MSCTDCNSSILPSQIYNLQYQYNPNCTTSSDCGTSSMSSKCIIYKGADLECSGIETDDTLEVCIQKMDTLICQTAGDYSTYNVNCIADAGTITTEAEFVDAITDYVCTLHSTVATFIGTTFPAYQTTVSNRFVAIEQPARTCVSASVTSADTLNTVLDKYCTKFGSIDTKLDISTVDWDQCYVVSSSPTTLANAFDLLIDQICQIKADSTSITLPTFNNSTSCLSITGTANTLVETINALKTRVCLSPTFDINALTWGCISKPSSSTTNLQAAFQSILTKVDILSDNSPTFSSDFTVTLIDSGNACLGKHVALATPLNSDRFVASNEDDDSPSTLIDKLEAGDNIILDDTTTPGKIIIASTSTDTQGRVYADITDNTLGYLDQKLEGSVGDYVTVTTNYDSINKKVEVAAFIDKRGLLLTLLEIIRTDEQVRTTFCTLFTQCPSPCQPPQNVQALYVAP